jgi:glyoxylase-like metal-dependent hydrolase (beta-lactamase superfamily II)
MLRGAVLCVAGSNGLVSHALAQGTSPLRESKLRSKLLQVTGAGGNIVLLGDESGVAMIDSGAPEHSDRVSSFIGERFGGAPVELLFNTHWHLGHTGGNQAVAQGAKIIAHENTRLWMATEFYVDWEDRTYPARSIDSRPNQTFYSSDPQPIRLVHAGQPIEYGLLREAHTDGDIYVRFPDQNVIAAGGAVSVGQYPVLDYITGGLIGGLIQSTEKLIKMSDGETLIVPSVGPAQSRSYLEAQRDMLAALLDRIEKMGRQGKSPEEMLAAGITREFDAKWGANAARFVTNVYNGLWAIGR